MEQVGVALGDAVGGARVVVRLGLTVVLTAECPTWLEPADLAEVLRAYVTSRASDAPAAPPAPDVQEPDAPAPARPRLALVVTA